MSKDLTDAEQARLERYRKTRNNRRGRTKPAIVPSKLARTSAFAPTNRNLQTDSEFKRVYVVKGHSVVEVEGRELGSAHRDALYALFRVPAKSLNIPNPNYDAGSVSAANNKPYRTVLLATTTWRDLLKMMQRTEHVNNLLTLLHNLEDLRKVTVRVFKGTYDQYMAATSRGRMPPGAGFSDGIIGSIEWDGPNLDSQLRVEYGKWIRETFAEKALVSLNADVYFRLQSDYAKCIWPWIDSQPAHTWIDEPRLGDLVGKPDLMQQPAKVRTEFRRHVRAAFEDMMAAGGLVSWKETIMGSGRAKIRRYEWEHALPRQFELELMAQSAASEDAAVDDQPA